MLNSRMRAEYQNEVKEKKGKEIILVGMGGWQMNLRHLHLAVALLAFGGSSVNLLHPCEAHINRTTQLKDKSTSFRYE